MTDPKIREKEKVTLISVKKQKRKKDGSEHIYLHIHAFVSNAWWKVQSKKCKIDRGIADKPFISELLDLYIE